MALTRVRYKGMSDVRIMSKADLASVGIGVDGQLKWEPKNHWSVFIEDISDELLEIFKNDGTFTVEEVDEETGKTVQTIVKGARLDDTGSTVVDATTGQKSTAATGKTGRGSST